MIDIKIIDDIDYNELLELYQCYQDVLPTKYGKFMSAQLLNNELMVENAKAIGLYKDNKLVGYIIGYGSSSVFILNSMYVEKQYRFYVKRLLDFMEAYLKSNGYIGWKATAITKEARSSLVTYGAKPIEIKYYKEI